MNISQVGGLVFSRTLIREILEAHPEWDVQVRPSPGWALWFGIHRDEFGFVLGINEPTLGGGHSWTSWKMIGLIDSVDTAITALETHLARNFGEPLVGYLKAALEVQYVKNTGARL